MVITVLVRHSRRHVAELQLLHSYELNVAAGVDKQCSSIGQEFLVPTVQFHHGLSALPHLQTFIQLLHTVGQSVMTQSIDRSLNLFLFEHSFLLSAL